MRPFKRFQQGRLWALIQKELRQILRDKQLLFLLIFPPTIQLFIYGFALSPDVYDLRLGVLDLSKTPMSRNLLDAVVQNHVFNVTPLKPTRDAAIEAVKQGKVDATMVIPPEFSRNLKQKQHAEIQILIDGVDANTAGIASGYLVQMISTFARGLEEPRATGTIRPDISFLYNPGLNSAWFFIPGVMGLILNLTGSLVSSSTLVREKDSGTLEQLVMTPASAFEVLLAKVLPLFVLLFGNVLLSLAVGLLAFHVPFRGNFFLFLAVSSLYILVAISIGITLASISKNQRQAILTSFFINLPVIQLSGAIAPLQSMPQFLQTLSYLNPLRYYIICIRSILLKGIGLEVIWPNVLMLAIFAVTLFMLSARRFRSQLG